MGSNLCAVIWRSFPHSLRIVQKTLVLGLSKMTIVAGSRDVGFKDPMGSFMWMGTWVCQAKKIPVNLRVPPR